MIIEDLRILNKLSRKHNLEVDKEFKYITSSSNVVLNRQLRKEGYELKYFSGCFYPYIIEV